jgi:hypothetical protein
MPLAPHSASRVAHAPMPLILILCDVASSVCASEKGALIVLPWPAPLLPSFIVPRPLAMSLLHGIIEAPIVRLRSCRTWQQPSAGRITSRTSPARRSCPRYVTAGCASTENAHVPFRGYQTHFTLVAPCLLHRPTVRQSRIGPWQLRETSRSGGYLLDVFCQDF